MDVKENTERRADWEKRSERSGLMGGRSRL